MRKKDIRLLTQKECRALKRKFKDSLREEFYRQVGGFLLGGVSVLDTFKNLKEGYCNQHTFFNNMAVQIKVCDEILLRSETHVDTFSELFVGLVPNHEVMLFVGSLEQLPDLLNDAIFVLNKRNQVKAAIKESLSEPAMSALMVGVMIYASYTLFLPNLISIQPINQDPYLLRSFYYFVEFVVHNGLYFIIPPILFVILSLISLPIWVGTLRDKFDWTLPFSVYKRSQATYFLMSLTSLVKSESNFLASIISISKYSSPYLRAKLDKAIIATGKGASPDKALKAMSLFNPMNLVSIEAYSRSHRLSDGLKILSAQAVSRLVKDVKAGFAAAGFLLSIASVAFTGYMILAMSVLTFSTH